MRTSCSIILFTLTLTVAAASFAQGDMREGLWEITVQADLAGQPMSEQPLVVRQCITRQSAQELMSQLSGSTGSCSVSDYRQDGAHATWNMVCTGQLSVSGKGEVTARGDSFTGNLELQVAMGAQSVPMNQKFSAHRIGDCK